MRIVLIGLCLSIFVVGCGSAPPKSAPTYSVEFERFSAPIGEELQVDIGDFIFVEGEVARAPVLIMANGIVSTMPGAYGVPFSFSIDQTELRLWHERGQHEYFCAATENRAASFPGLGAVVADGDCIGVRRNKTNGQLEWVVDNSIHNRAITVWARKLTPDDGVTFSETMSIIRDKRADTEGIYYQGFHSGLLHFSHFVSDDGQRMEQEFKFDYPPKEGEAVYGIRGKIFEVLDVDNTQFSYRWVSIP